MSLSNFLSRAVDVRPNELRPVLVSFFGAYSVLSFLILSRALRNALYVTTFDVTTLPYVTVAVAILAVPTVGLFGRAMASTNPHLVYSIHLINLSVAIGAILVFNETAPEITVVAFYIVTVLGASLLTTGFWIVTSEHYSLRQAKRLFGLIGAGGTLGAMMTGLAVNELTDRFTTYQLVPGLIVLLAIVLVLLRLMPKIPDHHHHGDAGSGTAIREGIATISRSPHLRNIAAVVLLATVVSTVLDYQFIEVVSDTYDNRDAMAGFFAAFYGWTGLISLVIQVLLAAWLMSRAGIAISLAILPVLLVAGSGAMLLVPAALYFWTATATRGVDLSLRKSLHRSVLEYVYVPVAADVRRKTKAFIDSVVDNVAGGIGSALLFVWVTWAGLPSRYLSAWVIGLAVAFIYIAFRTGAQYQHTVRERLTDDSEQVDTSGFDHRSLLTVTLTNLDIEAELARAGLDEADDPLAVPDSLAVPGRRGTSGDAPGAGASAEETSARETSSDEGLSTEERLRHRDTDVVRRALHEIDDWDPSHVEALTRLLARSNLYPGAVEALLQVGDAAVDHLIAALLDENVDFVIRRRIPRILAEVDTADADRALIDALSAGRFEVRYRAAIALARRRAEGLPEAPGDWKQMVWEAIEREVSRDRPIWELQKILDGNEAGTDDFVARRVDVRGELSLEHTFRQLAMVLDPEPVKTAFHGILMDDEDLKSLSLEYLEQVLPDHIRKRLWPFIGDISEHQRRESMRSVEEVVQELSKTGATLFGDAGDRAALDEALRNHDDGKRGDGPDD